MMSAGGAVRRATVSSWQEMYEECGSATFFHSPAWSLAWQEYTDDRFRPDPRLVRLPDGGVAILCVTTEARGWRGRVHHLSPAGTYGGWVSPRPLSRDDERFLSGQVTRLAAVVWRQPPGPVARPLLGRHTRFDETHIIDLARGVADARARWSSAARRNVRRAERAGVEVRRGTGDGDWREYLALYGDTLQRWGSRASSSYGSALFEALRKHGRTDVDLWLARLEGRPAAGALLVSHGRHVVYWHGASDPLVCPGSSNLLHWRIMDALAARGVTEYDLNPSGGHEGVVRFKRGLGSEPRSAPLVQLRPPWRALLGAARAGLTRTRGRAT
jgi:hypothetical protein